jgi:hypothetical protein
LRELHALKEREGKLLGLLSGIIPVFTIMIVTIMPEEFLAVLVAILQLVLTIHSLVVLNQPIKPLRRYLLENVEMYLFHQQAGP